SGGDEVRPGAKSLSARLQERRGRCRGGIARRPMITDLPAPSAAPGQRPDRAPAVPSHEPASSLNVVVFSGGRGSGTLMRQLLGQPHIALTFAINGYDDGASTGEVRRFLDDCLGP